MRLEKISSPERCGGGAAAGQQPRVALDNGTLRIAGTNGADKIDVSKDDKGNVVVKSGDQVLGTFPADEVQKIHVRGHRGADDIKVDVGQDIKVRVRGGRGKDNIEVDNAKDAFVRGGRGNDTIKMANVTGARVNGCRGDDSVQLSGDDNAVLDGAGDDQNQLDGDGNQVVDNMPAFKAASMQQRRC